MTWRQPDAFWGLLVVLALAALYRQVALRAPARSTVAFPVPFAAEAAAHAGATRRHLAAALLALALVVIVSGVARPVVPWPTPSGYPVALIVDVSRSMEENDVLPSRIEATKTAAVAFVDGMPRSAKIALVTFGNYATVVVPLTDEHDRVRDAIRNLTTQLRTQLGTGLVEGVRAVTGEGGSVGPAPSPPADGIRAIAILMSDGRASDGIPPLEAAAEAKARGVRVHTVGVGTNAPPSQLRSGYFGVLDEATLRAIAAETGGTYYHASAAGRLRHVYRELARTIGWSRRPTEVTAGAAGLALVLLVASVLLGRRVYFPI